jgi:hypothetical protein
MLALSAPSAALAFCYFAVVSVLRRHLSGAST